MSDAKTEDTTDETSASGALCEGEYLQVQIVTPTKVAFEGKVCWLSVQTVDGLMEVLPGHAQLVTPLDIGLARLSFQGDLHYSVAVNGGIMQVDPDRVLILAGRAERPEDVDLENVEERLEKISEELAGLAHLTRTHRLIQEKMWAEARIGAGKSRRAHKSAKED